MFTVCKSTFTILGRESVHFHQGEKIVQQCSIVKKVLITRDPGKAETLLCFVLFFGAYSVCT